jgi:small subunit ribosomal protein S17
MAKTIIATVSSNKTDKTITVTVRSSKNHPLYHKQYAVTKKFLAHDEQNSAQVGDRVEITETRPLSARKHHMLTKVIEKAAIRTEDTPEQVTAEPEVKA